jgi:hypothetical protein
VGLYTFQEAFDKTGRIINITVAPNNNYDPPRLLNYLTAPHVCVWSAAAASCALPGNREHSARRFALESGLRAAPEHPFPARPVCAPSLCHHYALYAHSRLSHSWRHTLYMMPAGIFDSVSLIVKEPNGQFRPENEWTRQGECACLRGAAGVAVSPTRILDHVGAFSVGFL